jgi:hypothetical protein
MRKLKWAMLLLVVIVLVVSSSTAVSAQKTQGTVAIASPPKNGKIGPTQVVSGKAQLSKGYTLWIVPYDGMAGKYYPQGSPVTVRSDASWTYRLSFGTIGVGKKFQIQAIVVDKNANGVLNNYVRTGRQTGITKLPIGAQAVNAITVTRVAANAAGVTSLPRPLPIKATSSKTTSETPITLPITTPSAAPISANTATSSVTQASVGASPSRNPLPGFEGIYALGALAAVFVLLLKRRRW